MCHMNIVYYNQDKITSDFSLLFTSVFPDMRKTQLNILPDIIFGMISSESSSVPDIAKSLKGSKFDNIKFDSISKRIRRFFSNYLFDSYIFYSKIIKYIINNYKVKHPDKKVHITFDHMFSHDNYSVFMISMRVGKQGIPLYFRCFKGMFKDAFDLNMILDGILYVHNLFKDKDVNLIFLADRWFNSHKIWSFIDSLGHIFVIRTKNYTKVLVFDKKEGHKVWKRIYNLDGYKYHSKFYNDIIYSYYHKLNINLVISKSVSHKEPFILLTNGDPKSAVKEYKKRFGSIECIFKNQKSNGFRLESINRSSLKSFTTMYSLVCFCITFLVILGTSYAKNTRQYKNEFIKTHSIRNGKRVRTMSLFNVGLTLFKRSFNSSKYIYIPFNLKLYDI